MRLPVISTASTEYVQVPVRATDNGVVVDLGSATVEMAFTRGDAPATWYESGVDADTSSTPTTYRVQCLIGPSGEVALGVGLWQVWVRITDSPEIVVKQAGSLKVV